MFDANETTIAQPRGSEDPLGFHEVAPGIMKMNGFDVYAYNGTDPCPKCKGTGKRGRGRCGQCGGRGTRPVIEDYRKRAGLHPPMYATTFARDLEDVRKMMTRAMPIIDARCQMAFISVDSLT
jgi:RecJ-like exonuclease